MANMTKFTPKELQDIIKKNPNDYSDLYSRFVLGFVLNDDEFPRRLSVNDTYISSLVAGVIAKVDKSLLIDKLAGAHRYVSKNLYKLSYESDVKLVEILTKIIESNDPYPDHQTFVNMIYDKCHGLDHSINMFVLSLIDAEKYSKIKDNEISTYGDKDLYFMLKACT